MENLISASLVAMFFVVMRVGFVCWRKQRKEREALEKQIKQIKQMSATELFDKTPPQRVLQDNPNYWEYKQKIAKNKRHFDREMVIEENIK